MLKRCQHCKQVVEIANLSVHLLTECDSKDNFGLCKRCTEAILKTDLDAHVKAKTCNRQSRLKFPLLFFDFTTFISLQTLVLDF